MGLTTSLTLAYHQKANHTDPLNLYNRTNKQRIRKLGERILGISRGIERPLTAYCGTLSASQTCVASSSGDTTLTINGVALTGTAGADQTATATATAAAVNTSTNALVQYLVQASNLAATLTVSTGVVGGIINICGYQLKPVAQASIAPGAFLVTTGNDTTTAAAIVTAIHATPGLQDIIRASNSSGVVTVRSRVPTLNINSLVVVGNSSITANVSALAATTTVCISAIHKGVSGNCITSAISGTGTSIGGARLTGGTQAVVSLP